MIVRLKRLQLFLETERTGIPFTNKSLQAMTRKAHLLDKTVEYKLQKCGLQKVHELSSLLCTTPAKRSITYVVLQCLNGSVAASFSTGRKPTRGQLSLLLRLAVRQRCRLHAHITEVQNGPARVWSLTIVFFYVVVQCLNVSVAIWMNVFKRDSAGGLQFCGCLTFLLN